MSGSPRSVSLADIAELNPRHTGEFERHDLVSFVPMSAVSAETASTELAEERTYEAVSRGYSSFGRGDILVAKITPCFQNNKIALARIPHALGFGSTEFHVVRPRKDCVNSRYLLHFLRQDSIRHAGERRMTGAGGQRRVPESFLAQLEVPLPPLAEQVRLADLLDRAEALRARRRETLAKLAPMDRAVFLEMFGDPVSNARGWPLRKLGDVGVLDRGVSRHRPRNDPRLLGGPYPLIQTGEVANSDGRIRTFSATYSEDGLRQSKMWPSGTLCITIAANIAKTGILAFDACFPDSVVGFSAQEQATVTFVQTWLSFLQKMLEDTAPEAAQKNINLAILRDLDVPLPPLDLQRAFAERARAIEEVRAYCRRALALSDELFGSLQFRAFAGML